uniref:CUB domain-containing protein n=1 Tax=Heterorhabditis bacteriophora TaxID=37862 RepID=A0A1I7WHZ9_HETBA
MSLWLRTSPIEENYLFGHTLSELVFPQRFSITFRSGDREAQFIKTMFLL